MENIWEDFAKLNGMTNDDFFSELVLSTIAAMSMKLDKSENNTLKLTRGKYVLTLIDMEKEINDE